jgi:hypothetical protein
MQVCGNQIYASWFDFLYMQVCGNQIYASWFDFLYMQVCGTQYMQVGSILILIYASWYSVCCMYICKSVKPNIYLWHAYAIFLGCVSYMIKYRRFDFVGWNSSLFWMTTMMHATVRGLLRRREW